MCSDASLDTECVHPGGHPGLTGSLSLLRIVLVQIILRTVTVGRHDDDKEFRNNSVYNLPIIGLLIVLHFSHLEPPISI